MEVILASAAALIAAPSMARDPQADILAIQLPGGGVEQIRYTGDSSPTAIFAPAPMAEPDFVSEAAFAALDRISAAADWCPVQKKSLHGLERPIWRPKNFGAGCPVGSGGRCHKRRCRASPCCFAKEDM